jgi:hypothetical protein
MEWFWKTLLWLTKISVILCLSGIALSTLFAGFIPGLQILWIITGVMTLINACLINFWWLKLGLFNQTKRFGQNIQKSLPKFIGNGTENTILKAIEKNFQNIAHANGLELEDIFEKIMSASDGLKIRLKSIKAFRQSFACPIKLIQIEGMNIIINVDEQDLQKNFFQSHIGQTKLYLMSQEIANIITGILLHKWLKITLTNDASISATINQLTIQPPNQLTQQFCRDEKAKKIIRSQFMEKINDMIVHNGHIIHDGTSDFDPTNPTQQPCENDIPTEFSGIDFEIEEKKYDTKDIESAKKSDQLVDSGSLEET